MTSTEAEKMREVFSRRLQELMSENNIAQAELSYVLGMDRSTVNKWIMKKALPRMAIIEKLASYFGVEKSYFLDENADTEMRSYYLNPETAKIAQAIHDDKNLRILFDASQKLEPEDIEYVVSLVQRLKKKESGGDDES